MSKAAFTVCCIPCYLFALMYDFVDLRYWSIQCLRNEWWLQMICKVHLPHNLIKVILDVLLVMSTVFVSSTTLAWQCCTQSFNDLLLPFSVNVLHERCLCENFQFKFSSWHLRSSLHWLCLCLDQVYLWIQVLDESLVISHGCCYCRMLTI